MTFKRDPILSKGGSVRPQLFCRNMEIGVPALMYFHGLVPGWRLKLGDRDQRGGGSGLSYSQTSCLSEPRFPICALGSVDWLPRALRLVLWAQL